MPLRPVALPVLCAASVCLAGALWLAWPQPQVEAGSPPPSAHAVTAVPALDRPSARLAAGPEPAWWSMPDQGGQRARPAAGGRQAWPLREALERAPDLQRFYRTLAPGVLSGDAETLWVASRVQEYCAGYAADPGAFAHDSHQMAALLPADAAAVMAGARAVVAHRCAGFAPGDGLGYVWMLAQREDAAEAGSLAAEAALLAMQVPLEDTPAYRRDLVERVRTARDPDAFAALAPAMGLAASGDAAHAGQVAGSMASGLAWQVAACRLGQACGGQGVVMTGYCATGGVCAPDARLDFEQFARGQLSRREADEVDTLVGELLDEVRSR